MGEGGERCTDETLQLEPQTAYGRTKREAERLVLDAGSRSAMHVCILRMPLVYGAGVKGNLLRMMQAIDRGRFPPLPDSGNKRSMVHVDDVVQAALLATENPRANGQSYIVTDGRTYTTRELYVLTSRALGKAISRWSLPMSALQAATTGDWLGRLRGRRFPFDSDTLDKLLGSAWYSTDKISRELGYRPSRTFADSVGEMVAAYQQGVRSEGRGGRGDE
jgi:UDP-glucose 4-epimerase